MQIVKPEQKKEMLDAMERLGEMIPVLDMDDRDFTAALLYRMSCVVRKYGPSHGVSLNSVLIDELSVSSGKMYEVGLRTALREAEDRKKSVLAFKLDEGDIKKVIYNPPATIIDWKDGTKTVVKCSDEDLDAGRISPEYGIVYAIVKKVLGNKGNYNNVLKRLVERAAKG